MAPQDTEYLNDSYPDIPPLTAEAIISEGREFILPVQPDRPFAIRGQLWPAAENEEGMYRGRVVVLPGFTEFCEKYTPLLRYLSQAGYECLIIDWPGQGLSGHLGAHPLIAHIDDFSQFHNSIQALVAEAGFTGQPFSVIGHSMGGHLALHCQTLFPYELEQIILLAPMIVPKAPPLWWVLLASRMLIWAGMSHHAIPMQRPVDLQFARKFRIDNPLTTDPDGFDWQYRIFEKKPHLRRSLPSVGWVNAAFRSCIQTTLNPDWMREITVPVTALLAGDERIVNPQKAVEMLSYVSQLKQQIFANARHELLGEIEPVRRRVFHMILDELKSESRRY